MPLFQVAIIRENDEDGQTPPNDFTGRMLGVDVINGVSEPEKWRDIRRFAAKGFVTGEAGSERMNRLERLAKHGPIPRLPTEEELEAIDVPEEFEDVVPDHNERLKLMKDQGFNPYEVISHLNKEQSLAFFWVFEKGSGVLDELDLPEEDEDEADEALEEPPETSDSETANEVDPPEEDKESTSAEDNGGQETLEDSSPPTETTVDEDGEVTVEEQTGEEEESGPDDDEAKEDLEGETSTSEEDEESEAGDEE